MNIMIVINKQLLEQCSECRKFVCELEEAETTGELLCDGCIAKFDYHHCVACGILDRCDEMEYKAIFGHYLWYCEWCYKYEEGDK